MAPAFINSILSSSSSSLFLENSNLTVERRARPLGEEPGAMWLTSRRQSRYSFDGNVFIMMEHVIWILSILLLCSHMYDNESEETYLQRCALHGIWSWHVRTTDQSLKFAPLCFSTITSSSHPTYSWFLAEWLIRFLWKRVALSFIPLYWDIRLEAGYLYG